MSEEVSIPLLRELISRGTLAPEQEPISLSNLNNPEQGTLPENNEHDDEIEQEYHAALQQIQDAQLAIEFDTSEIEPESADNSAIETSADHQPVPVDEAIRQILDRHMAAASQEIIELIRRTSH